jgi:hypothetical protein
LRVPSHLETCAAGCNPKPGIDVEQLCITLRVLW